MAIDVMPDCEGGLRTWLRVQPDVSALVGTRVFFGIPRDGATFPFVTLERIGGSDDDTDVPLDVALIQFQVWAASKASGFAVVAALRGALRSIRSATLLDTGICCFGADVDLVLFQPDPETDRPRYIVTARVSVIAV